MRKRHRQAPNANADSPNQSQAEPTPVPQVNVNQTEGETHQVDTPNQSSVGPATTVEADPVREAPSSASDANVPGWAYRHGLAYRGPAWIKRALEFDVRSIALFRVVLAGVVLWDICYEYLPEAYWFLHDSGYNCTRS